MKHTIRYHLGTLYCAILFVCTVVMPAAVSSADFVATVSVGQKNQDLSIRDRQFSPSFTTLDLAITAAINRYYISLNHEISIKDAIETDPSGLIFYSRTDTNLTFGYSLYEGLNLFAGFRTGETDSFYIADNSSLGITSSSFGNTSDGLYIGANSSYYFKQAGGSLSMSLAVASLDGEVALSEPFVDTSAFVVGTPPPATIKGSAVGFSFGLTWSGQVLENTIYNLGLKIQRYTFDDEVVFGGLDLSYEENYNTLSVGLTHFF